MPPISALASRYWQDCCARPPRRCRIGIWKSSKRTTRARSMRLPALHWRWAAPPPLRAGRISSMLRFSYGTVTPACGRQTRSAFPRSAPAKSSANTRRCSPRGTNGSNSRIVPSTTPSSRVVRCTQPRGWPANRQARTRWMMCLLRRRKEATARRAKTQIEDEIAQAFYGGGSSQRRVVASTRRLLPRFVAVHDAPALRQPLPDIGHDEIAGGRFRAVGRSAAHERPRHDFDIGTDRHECGRAVLYILRIALAVLPPFHLLGVQGVPAPDDLAVDRENQLRAVHHRRHEGIGIVRVGGLEHLRHDRTDGLLRRGRGGLRASASPSQANKGHHCDGNKLFHAYSPGL